MTRSTRAYSEWMHLWADGLEPCDDVVEACAREAARIEDGWAPFWHYRRLGMYGRQLADLFEHFPREQVLVLRYRQLVDDPHRTLNRVCRFLGVSQDVVTSISAWRTLSRPLVAQLHQRGHPARPALSDAQREAFFDPRRAHRD